MKALRLVGLLSLVVLAASCSSVDYYHDWDRDAPFESYKTYAWLNQPTTAVGDARAAQQQNTLLDSRIKRAVDARLSAKGFQVDTESPDVLVAYHIGVESKVNVTDWGYRYSYDYWGPRQIDVYEYDEGTLIVDLIDASAKELVWRGSATATLSDNPSPEKIERRLAEITSKMFEKYPPPEQR